MKCDRCGEEYDGNDKQPKIRYTLHKIYPSGNKHVKLCPACLRKLDYFIELGGRRENELS